MRKNGSRLISVSQYRATDLFLFVVILVIAELTAHYALVLFPAGAMFTISFMLPIVLTVMMRWGWYSVFYAILSGVLYCALNKGSGAMYLTYGIGNAFIGLLLILLRFVDKRKISGKWYHSVWFVALGWLLVYLGRATVSTICCAVHPIEGVALGDAFIAFAMTDLVSLVMGIVVVLVLRRFDGMFEDQMSYLTRTDKVRREKMRADEFGEEPIEIDEETLGVLNKHNDLYD